MKKEQSKFAPEVDPSPALFANLASETLLEGFTSEIILEAPLFRVSATEIMKKNRNKQQK